MTARSIDRAVCFAPATASATNGLSRVGPLARGRIGTVDGKMRQQLDQRAAQRSARLTSSPSFARQPMERAGAGFELRRKAARDDLAARRLLLDGEVGAAAADRLPQRAERALAPRASCCTALTSFMKS